MENVNLGSELHSDHIAARAAVLRVMKEVDTVAPMDSTAMMWRENGASQGRTL